MFHFSKKIGLAVCLSVGSFLLVSCSEKKLEESSSAFLIDSLILDHVWSGHPVGFATLIEPPHQFIAYYDSSRAMVIAQRELGKKEWKKKILPETLGWDTHNYIAMALDSKGHLHVSGNMHADPLVYFQASSPYDVSSLARKKQLTGQLEDRVTYPKFFTSPNGDLIFTYRDGGSGNGNQIYNRYEPEIGRWSRLLDQPLVDGEGKRNAYLRGPTLGPDGYYHLVWVWRDTPDASTNHDLSYAKSKDLIHWEQSNGKQQDLPITFENGEIVDPVPIKEGMINSNITFGFDLENQPVLTYHKYDKAGNTQIYNARRTAIGWKIHQLTNWNFRWNFGGRGSIGKRLSVFPVEVEQGQLTQRHFIDTAGMQKFLLHQEDLSIVKELILEEIIPERLEKVRSDFPGMKVRTLSQTTANGDVYLLRWETLTRNRDRPRTGPLPEASPLVLYHIVP